MKNYSYIAEIPFKGIITNSLNPDTGAVHYTGKKKTTRTVKNGVEHFLTSWENPLTVEEYKKLPENAGKNLKVFTSAEMDVLFEAYQQSLIEDFKEISEESYDYFLGVLPPVRFTKVFRNGNFFFISEAYTGNLHKCIAELNGKYFSALRRVNEPTLSIMKAIRKAFDNL